MRVPVVPHACQHLVLSVLWILAVLLHMKWYLIAVICNSWMTHDAEYLLIFFLFSFFCFFKTTPMAYGGSQARGPSRATTASLRHSHTRSELCLWPTSRQRQILNLLSETRDRTTTMWFLVGVISAAPQRALPFSCTYFCLLYVVFDEVSVQIFCAILNWVVWVFYCEDLRGFLVLIFVRYIFFIRHVFCKYFLPVCGMSF